MTKKISKTQIVVIGDGKPSRRVGSVFSRMVQEYAQSPRFDENAFQEFLQELSKNKNVNKI